MTSTHDFLLGFVSILTLIAAVLGLVLDALYAEVIILGFARKSAESLIGIDRQTETTVSIAFAALAIVSATSGAVFSVAHLTNMFEIQKKRWIIVSYLFTTIFSLIAWTTFIAFAEDNMGEGSELLGLLESEWGYEAGTFMLVATTTLSMIALGLCYFLP